MRLDGQVPQKQRNALVQKFQTNPKCRCFLTTNAGSTGLNLQAADTVINVNLPWNPALLEQRIARAHRMGQKRKVQVYLLITEGTIEENLLATLGAKHELAAAVLDPDSDLREVQLVSGMDELKRRLEMLLGSKPEADKDVSLEQRVAEETTQIDAAKKAQIGSAGGQLITSAFTFLGQVLPAAQAPSEAAVGALQKGLEQCLTTNAEGQPQLTITLPGLEALETMARAMAALMASAGQPG